MRKRISRPDRCGALAPALIEILLTGDSVTDEFLIFDLNDADLARLWRAHRSDLLREWKRQGKPGAPWGAKFDTEEFHV